MGAELNGIIFKDLTNT